MMAAGTGISAPKPGASVEEVWAFARALQTAYFDEKQSRKDWANEASAFRTALEQIVDRCDEDRRVDIIATRAYNIASRALASNQNEPGDER